MGFTILTTISPEFERARKDFIPTWYANSGTKEIVVRELDEGNWAANIAKRAEILRDELLERLPRGEQVLALDADCLVLRDLTEGFSDEHIMSVARWPNVNLGVIFFNLSLPFKWERWLKELADDIRKEAQRERKATHECDQVVWRPRLHAMEARIFKLSEWMWNYNNFEMSQWRRELPAIHDIVRILHIKGHGDWNYADLDAKIQYAKTLWPEELACIG